MSSRSFDKSNSDFGHVLVTGGSGFVGKNLVKTLLDRGYTVRSFDIVDSDLEHDNLEKVTGNICSMESVESACRDIQTIFHTAAFIGLSGGKAITDEYRQKSLSINVEGTKNLLTALQNTGGQRFIYMASNSVVIDENPIQNGDETLPYVNVFNDMYTETKVIAEKWVLGQSGEKGVLTTSIRPSGIWGPGDQTMFKMFFEQVLAGTLIAKIGNGDARLDNSYVDNLIHGMLLAAEHLVEGGTSPAEAYFINDGDPINMFDFSTPIIEAIGWKMPKLKAPGSLVKILLGFWQSLHLRFRIAEPPMPPLAVNRLTIDNYFSTAKAKRDLGYEPLFTTQQAIDIAKPFYVDMFNKMKNESK